MREVVRGEGGLDKEERVEFEGWKCEWWWREEERRVLGHIAGEVLECEGERAKNI